MQSLEQRWHSFAKRVIIPQPDSIWDSLVILYSEEGRHYHNLRHIHDCLLKLDRWPAQPPQKNAIELALWFHDVIYESRRADNEDASAALATHFLRGHPLETDVCALILSTRHRVTQGMPAEEVICDIDLSILGAQAHDYDNYAANVRKEYSWVEPEEYRLARTKVLEDILERERIFQSHYGHSRWETQARLNLAQECLALRIESGQI